MNPFEKIAYVKSLRKSINKNTDQFIIEKRGDKYHHEVHDKFKDLEKVQLSLT